MEIPTKLHRDNYTRLHPLKNKGGIGANRPGWDQFRKDYWRARYIDELMLCQESGQRRTEKLSY